MIETNDNHSLSLPTLETKTNDYPTRTKRIIKKTTGRINNIKKNRKEYAY